ncbi:TetR/AcrR family transcriptional regulator [Micromonospora sp. KC207]|uniref:TetR/AcrR family transcriptional regulator n=1 Tax=Micromonospora sp. KC207 TaxID=2530377 RepID=UPI001053FE3E|nr:TetR/AcrR family transcriptional regulator [Micromonospora sp. KC207]TDC61208.1 TetR/AcrR family transcriptional regulator [Micromonospora sp. KC207]
MARPVNLEQHRQRRLQIIDAALTCFAASGFDGASTAAICRTAGIGSGTFFHYFPTKVDVMVAILELGADETAEFFRSQAGQKDAVEVLLAYADHEADNAQDTRAGGFLRAVVVATSHERVATALTEHQRRVRSELTPWVTRAREQGRIRTDLSAERTISWLLALIDGFGSQVADWSPFDARRERNVLRETIRRFLAP